MRLSEELLTLRMQQPNNVIEKWVIGHAACDESLRKWAKVASIPPTRLL
jgi:hypothetical protein